MKVLDANYLIDYLNGEPATKEFYEANGGDEERWIAPAPAYAETIVGVGNLPDGNVDRAIDALAWVDVIDVDEELSIEAARIADEIGSQGPFLDGVDALVAALGRTHNATVVSIDSDLTHPETKQVVDVTDY
ncbi:PIN domain-containing protein [Haloterrigena alkaliphila]|uniref:PIN domain-containing protein n=1 Tax=Haloterrigena alkaliphila TaxID=2816475 RepID=UPI001D0004AD|nr:PIN domain-containing protein [Haloterrigena alkaliphila]UHQ95320.1 PIN domain-containing protein [Haloterrigena alkaliphila]